MISNDNTDDQSKPLLRKKSELKLRPVTKDLKHPVDNKPTTADFTIPEDPKTSDAEPTMQQPAEVSQPKESTPVLNVIRGKLSKLYEAEPDADEEAVEAYQAGAGRSKHQQFMLDLTNSGKSLAQIQIDWHKYYQNLPDNEKHEVWQEFYSAHEHQKHHLDSGAGVTYVDYPANEHDANTQNDAKKSKDTRSVADVKSQILAHVSGGGKLKAKHHVQSLLFGLGLASLFVLVLLFGFFNERFIAPFVSPSRQVSATPIVGNGQNVGPNPIIIIPKINLEVPVVYGLNTIEEKTMQANLENGVVHYSTSPEPGHTGNVVIVGHSSNNILNKGKYKFAFVLLKRLEIGDTFSLNKDGVRYVYQVFDKKIVSPTDVSVLGPTSKANSATLITCDPPGTSINRLIIVGEQISPDPNTNKSTAQSPAPQLSDKGILPSNAPSLWQRIKNIF